MNAMTADLRRLVKKNYGDALYTLVCTRGKEITKKTLKKRNVYGYAYISPLRSAYPLP